jgi:fructokinase
MMNTNMPAVNPPRILVWGELLWDVYPDEERLGGAPANVAWHLAMLGARVALISRVGDDDRGRRAASSSIARGVDTSLVQVDHERATGEVRVRTQAGEPKYTLVPERAWERIACTGAVREALGTAAAVVFGTLAQRTDDGLASWRAMIAAAPAGCAKVCDVNLRPGHLDRRAVDAALAAAEILKINDAELATLGREAIHARLVAITHGPAGATITTGAETVEIAGVAARPGGDNVGCGDAWLAVLVHGLTQGWPLARTGAIASRWAAEVASHRGATPAFPGELISAMLSPP